MKPVELGSASLNIHAFSSSLCFCPCVVQFSFHINYQTRRATERITSERRTPSLIPAVANTVVFEASVTKRKTRRHFCLYCFEQCSRVADLHAGQSYAKCMNNKNILKKKTKGVSRN